LNKSQKEKNAKKIKIVLLTDDAKESVAFSVRDYVKSMTDTLFLQDKLCLKEYGAEQSSKPLYPPHLTLVQIHDGIKMENCIKDRFWHRVKTSWKGASTLSALRSL
jgi:hypothetical protein